MATIWEDEYLKNHTKTQLNKLLDSYDKADWQCPRCDEVNPVYERMRVIRGWNDFGTRYTFNKYCYECNFIRKNGKEFNLNGKKPRKKRITGTWTEKYDLAYREGRNTHGKWYTIELYEKHKTVLVYWGSETAMDSSGAFKEFNFDSKQEAREFFEAKLEEKFNKGYFDRFPSYSGKPKKEKSSKPKVKKSTRKPRSKKSVKKAPVKSRTKKKVLTRKK